MGMSKDMDWKIEYQKRLEMKDEKMTIVKVEENTTVGQFIIGMAKMVEDKFGGDWEKFEAWMTEEEKENA